MIGSLILSLTWVLTKLAHIMKNMRTCSATSSEGGRWGSGLLPLSPAPWLMADLPLRLGRFDGGARTDIAGRRTHRLPGVVVHLRQQIVGHVGRIHAHADQ